MSGYTDGFVFPIARDKLDEYRQLATAIAEIWKEHGALEYREWVGDEMHLEGTRSFSESVAPGDGEVVIFGWVTFLSRQDRDLANQKVFEDPRVQSLMQASDTGFDPGRMAYGGFKSFI